MYHNKANNNAKYDWEKEEEKEGEKWYKKRRGKNTQHAKESGLSTPQINCWVASFLTFLASKKLFQDFQLPPREPETVQFSNNLHQIPLTEPDAVKIFSAQCTTHSVAKLYS